jgi:hypothetical protein
VIAKGLIPGFPGTLESWEKDTGPSVMSWIEEEWSQSQLNIVIIDWFQNTQNYLDTLKGIMPK